jgi:nifR3 family TIM-barrel protein
MWNIGKVEIKNKVVLAPMAGISNPSYMKICEEMQVGYVVTELISAEAIVRANKKTLEMLNGIEILHIPFGIQLFGSNPETLKEAAKYIEEQFHPAVIDINMGCPVPKVATRAGAGSALLKHPEQVEKIVRAVVENVHTPVTVKIRSGWDHDHICATEIAKVIEKSGASAICVHPRTRAQGYSGKADWNIIKEVKQTVKIPVIGNGDIRSCYDAKKMLDETGCDAIMIGRAALGNPWLIRECVAYLEMGENPIEVTIEEKISMMEKHLNNLIKFKNEKAALLEIRSHISWYLKGVPHGNELKIELFKTKTIEDVRKLIEEFKERVGI